MHLLTFLIGFFYATAANLPQTVLRTDLTRADYQLKFFAEALSDEVKMEGTGNHKQALTGNLFFRGTDLLGEAEFDLDTLDTGINLRTQHMKRVLDTKNYPKAKLALEHMALPREIFTKPNTTANVNFTSQLTLHGKTLPLAGAAKVSRHNADFEITFEFIVEYPKFGVKTPSFLGVTLKPFARVQLNLKKVQFRKQ